MRFLVVPSLLAALIVFAACSGAETKTVTVEKTVTETATGTVPSEAPAVLTLYFLRDGKVAPAARPAVVGSDVAAAAVRELLEGPEADDADLDTAIPERTLAGETEVAGDMVIVGCPTRLRGPRSSTR
jgi:spore germination protein GerM